MPEESVPMEQYQNLQRELQKARDKQKDLLLSRLDTDELKAKVEHLTDLVSAFVVTQTDADEPAPKVKEVLDQAKTIDAAIVVRKEIASLLSEADVDWSDPQLAEVRKLYDEDKFQDAVDAVKKALNKPSDINALVAAEVQKNLRTLKIDTGTTTAPPGVPTDPAELREKLKDPKWFRENKEKVMQMAREGHLQVKR